MIVHALSPREIDRRRRKAAGTLPGGALYGPVIRPQSVPHAAEAPAPDLSTDPELTAAYAALIKAALNHRDPADQRPALRRNLLRQAAKPATFILG